MLPWNLAYLGIKVRTGATAISHKYLSTLNRCMTTIQIDCSFCMFLHSISMDCIICRTYAHRPSAFGDVPRWLTTHAGTTKMCPGLRSNRTVVHFFKFCVHQGSKTLQTYGLPWQNKQASQYYKLHPKVLLLVELDGTGFQVNNLAVRRLWRLGMIWNSIREYWTQQNPDHDIRMWRYKSPKKTCSRTPNLSQPLLISATCLALFLASFFHTPSHATFRSSYTWHTMSYHLGLVHQPGHNWGWPTKIIKTSVVWGMLKTTLIHRIPPQKKIQ